MFKAQVGKKNQGLSCVRSWSKLLVPLQSAHLHGVHHEQLAALLLTTLPSDPVTALLSPKFKL